MQVPARRSRLDRHEGHREGPHAALRDGQCAGPGSAELPEERAGDGGRPERRLQGWKIHPAQSQCGDAGRGHHRFAGRRHHGHQLDGGGCGARQGGGGGGIGSGEVSKGQDRGVPGQGQDRRGGGESGGQEEQGTPLCHGHAVGPVRLAQPKCDGSPASHVAGSPRSRTERRIQGERGSAGVRVGSLQPPGRAQCLALRPRGRHRGVGQRIGSRRLVGDTRGEWSVAALGGRLSPREGGAAPRAPRGQRCRPANSLTERPVRCPGPQEGGPCLRCLQRNGALSCSIREGLRPAPDLFGGRGLSGPRG